MIYISNDEIKKNINLKKPAKTKKIVIRKSRNKFDKEKKTSKPCALLNLV